MIDYLFGHLGRGATYLLIGVSLIVVFVAWLASPMDWRNAEGSVVDDGRKWARWLRRLLWWM